VVKEHCLAKVFIDSLDDVEQKKIVRLLKYTADKGIHPSKEKFRHEGDKIYAFKTTKTRMLCFFSPERSIVLTHGYFKTGQKLDPEEKKRALKYKEEYFKKKGGKK